jgi:NitT/TauT family transport system ATP-binding protein
MMARRSARQITPTLSDGSAVLLAARGAIGESPRSGFEWRSHITIVHGLSASIACSLRAGLHKRNPALRRSVAMPLDFQEGVWLASGLHALPAMMRMQPHSEFSGVPVPASATPIAIELSEASVTFGRGDRAVPALATTSLRIADGEFVALVGPSGCGKSTILRLVSGLVQPSTGVVIVGGREVAARALRVGMAFQNPTMLPWMTIERNIMLPLKIVEPFRSQFRKLRKTAFRDKANALLEQVGLKGFGNRYPWQLSGGMLQRANLCRALIHEPRMLLLDEPFGALDQFTREELWSILQDLWIAHRPTVLLVTHDLREAAFLGSRICVMSARPGRILDDSQVTFARPRTVAMTFEPDFVALNQKLRAFIVDARTASAQGAA